MAILVALGCTAVTFVVMWFAPRAGGVAHTAVVLVLLAIVGISVWLGYLEGMDSLWSGVMSGIVLGGILAVFTRPSSAGETSS